MLVPRLLAEMIIELILPLPHVIDVSPFHSLGLSLRIVLAKPGEVRYPLHFFLRMCEGAQHYFFFVI